MKEGTGNHFPLRKLKALRKADFMRIQTEQRRLSRYDKPPHKWHIFYPEDKFILVWSVANSLILLLTCIMTPFTLAFSDMEEVDKNPVFKTINMTIDIYFTIDIFINMNTAYENHEYQLIDSRCKIFWNYCKSWLIIDILSVLPLELFLAETVDDSGGSMINVNQFVRITRISKLYKLVKITKLVRIIKIFKNKKKLEQKLKHTVKNGAAIDRLMFFIMIVFLMVHIMSCLWIFIASTTLDKNWI